MLLLNSALIHPNGVGTMNEMTSYRDCQSFPVEVFNEQDFIDLNVDRIKFICGKIICDAGYRSGRLGVVLTDNVTIHELNRRYLKHDYATDVISFNIDCTDTHLEGELVVSIEMAKERYEEFGWAAESEVLLYVIHGTLHQIGYDDQSKRDAHIMRRLETEYLNILGILKSDMMC